MHSSNDAAQQPSLNHANLFSFPPTQRNGLLDSPTTKNQALCRPTPQPADILRKTPSLTRPGIPQPSPGILTPHQQSSPDAPLISALTPQGRRPRVGQPGRDEGLVPQSFRRGQKASPHEVRGEAFCMPEDDWGTKPSSLPGICNESEYPCCYSALPTELRLVMRILTSSVISRIPSLAGFLGSKQAGFSAM